MLLRISPFALQYGLLICTSFYGRNGRSLFCQNSYFAVERRYKCFDKGGQ